MNDIYFAVFITVLYTVSKTNQVKIIVDVTLRYVKCEVILV